MNSTKIDNFVNKLSKKEIEYIKNKIINKVIIHYINDYNKTILYYKEDTTIQDIIDKIIKEKQPLITNSYNLFLKGKEQILLNTLLVNKLQTNNPLHLFAIPITFIYLADVFIILKIFSSYDYNVIYKTHQYNIYNIIKEYSSYINNSSNVYNILNSKLTLINTYSNIEKFDLNNIFKNVTEFIKHPDDIIDYYENLKIQHYHIISFPTNLFKAPQLQKLSYINISSCYLTEIPEDIFNIKTLEYLDLSINNFKYIPKTINKLINLKEFIIYKNEQVFEIEYLIDFMLKNTLKCFGICNNNLIYDSNETENDKQMYYNICNILKKKHINSYKQFIIERFMSYIYKTKK